MDGRRTATEVALIRLRYGDLPNANVKYALSRAGNLTSDEATRRVQTAKTGLHEDRRRLRRKFQK